MIFPLNVYLAVTVASAAAAFLSLPLWRRWCVRTGHVDDPGHRKIHHTPVPLAGGLAVLTGILLPLVAGLGWLLVSGRLSPMDAGTAMARWLRGETADLMGYGFSRRGLQVGAILVGALAMTLLGWYDDRHEIKPLAKFSGQLAIAFLVAASGVRITLFVDNAAFSYAVTILWILTVTNALNFMDNMNGLCSGLGMVGSFCFAAAAAAQGQYLVASIAFLAFGALLGFLPHNFPNASAFLGDAGSHLVGYLLAVLAILPHFYSSTNPHHLAVLGPLLILAVPLGDLVWVVLLRWRLGKPFYHGDTNHLSHRLVRRGLSKTRAVLVIWLIAAFAGAASLLLT